MRPDCLTSLEELIVSSLPRYIAVHRSNTEPLFTVRLNFYDTHAPKCYFALSLTYQSTAEKIMLTEGRHSIRKLWAGGESIHDEHMYFPETVERDFVYNPILDACYKYLCDDDIEDSYRRYAETICSAACRINANISNYFPFESDFFNLVPADDSFEFLGDDQAIRLAVPADRIQSLIRGGFLDDRDAHFGIYPNDV
jgi:hypothetical protein